MTTGERLMTLPEMAERLRYALRPELCCQRCDCCTRALCKAGRENPSGCIGLAAPCDAELAEWIAVCPCAPSPALLEEGR